MSRMRLEVRLSSVFEQRRNLEYRLEQWPSDCADVPSQVCCRQLQWGSFTARDLAHRDFAPGQGTLVYDGPAFGTRQSQSVLDQCVTAPFLGTPDQRGGVDLCQAFARNAPWLLSVRHRPTYAPDFHSTSAASIAVRAQLASLADPELDALAAAADALVQAIVPFSLGNPNDTLNGMYLRLMVLVSLPRWPESVREGAQVRLREDVSEEEERALRRLLVLLDQLKSVQAALEMDGEFAQRVWLALLPTQLHLLEVYGFEGTLQRVTAEILERRSVPQLFLHCWGPLQAVLSPEPGEYQAPHYFTPETLKRVQADRGYFSPLRGTR